MTDRWVAGAIIAAGLIVGGAIVGTRIIAPYEIAAGAALDRTPILWRLNVVTGKVDLCGASNVLQRNAAEAYTKANRDDPFAMIVAPAQCQ